MNNLFDKVAERAGKTIRHWWLYLLTGILSIAAGIIVFCNPLESYLTLSLMFGVLMLISGIARQRHGFVPHKGCRLGHCLRSHSTAPVTGHHAVSSDYRHNSRNHTHRLDTGGLRSRNYRCQSAPETHPRAFPFPRR